MDENEIGERVIGAAINVHRELGPGLLESAYEAALAFELEEIGLEFERQMVLPVVYRGKTIDAGYRVDLLVARKVIIELKAIEKVLPVHTAQVISYLKLGGFKLGYLLNFNATRMKDGVNRLVNGL